MTGISVLDREMIYASSVLVQALQTGDLVFFTGGRTVSRHAGIYVVAGRCMRRAPRHGAPGTARRTAATGNAYLTPSACAVACWRGCPDSGEPATLTTPHPQSRSPPIATADALHGNPADGLPARGNREAAQSTPADRPE